MKSLSLFLMGFSALSAFSSTFIPVTAHRVLIRQDLDFDIRIYFGDCHGPEVGKLIPGAFTPTTIERRVDESAAIDILSASGLPAYFTGTGSQNHNTFCLVSVKPFPSECSLLTLSDYYTFHYGRDIKESKPIEVLRLKTAKVSCRTPIAPTSPHPN
ncbi:uncharacterized protein C8R40DRAFT_649849 [Lentinula edodes]|uniref:uncharacterized protein n=1 Tax=Lentinula edodes TaxID=5353 RepID=UPI001E8EE240|nr:uncharacterized protein C8R40DRAFT_649849 [Lentinula edodes]KAH7870283.1 hypothetical protein C8R40DRAFT_649849 [Lentinula edodes]